MNFLAHMLLSRGEEELLVGNFLGDFTSNRDLNRYSPRIQQGIRLHREIDFFTDNHPEVRAGAARLRKQHGKYAPVAIDVYYDYILSRQWHRYGPASLPAFAQSTYEILLRYQAVMPPRIGQMMARMVADDWLVKYGTLSGIAFTFERLQSRASQPHWLAGATDTLQAEEAQLTEEFNRFFPDLMQHVESFCAC